MVVVQLIGGLGNQMFQYALGRCLAKRRNDELFLHLARLSSSTVSSQAKPNARNFGLDVFEIAGEITTLDKLQQDRANVIWTITESGFGFFPEVLEASDCHRNIGLMGWWQSENYFIEIANTIRSDFEYKSSYEPPFSSSMLDMVRNCESVCVHIRRTDYSSEEDTKGALKLDYYLRALEVIGSRLNDPRLFIFSDEIAWCRANLTFPLPATFVSSDDLGLGHAADDFYLMSMCKHFVIANSTYSWWAAWLGKAPEKLIVAPLRWFKAEDNAETNKSYLCSNDLVPNTWIRV